MERYFGDVVNNDVILSNDDINALLKANKNQEEIYFEVVSDEKCYIAKVTSFRPFTSEVVKQVKATPELDAYLIVAFPLFKNLPNQYLLKWATELGASEIVIYKSDNSLFKLKRNFDDNTLDNLKDYLKQISSNARRMRVPYIGNIIASDALFKMSGDYKFALVNHKEKSAKTIKQSLRASKITHPRIILAIGAENGFSDRELLLAKGNGFQMVYIDERQLSSELLLQRGLSQVIERVGEIK